MTIPYPRRKAATKLGLVHVQPGYFLPEDAEVIEALRAETNKAIERHMTEGKDK